MHYKLLLAIGSIISTSIITTIAVAMANPTPAKTCFMQTASGKTIDLTQICGQSSSVSPSRIDPNAPAQIVIPSSDRPSAMWRSIPDAPTAPIAGSTYERPINTKVQTIPATAASPSQ
jgi:hypothetical protein